MDTLHPPVPLAAVEAGRTVSHILLRTSGGSVTGFAFGAGESLSEHATPRDALFVVVEGEARVTLDGTPHTLTSGDTLRFPPDVPHAVEAVTDVRALLVLLRDA